MVFLVTSKCLYIKTTSASFFVTHSSLFDAKLGYEARTTHSTHLLLVLTKINLRKTEIVCSVERNLLKEINICEGMTTYTRGAAGGKVRTLTSATCGNYSGCWLLQAHDLLHVETRASHESQVVEDGGRSGA